MRPDINRTRYTLKLIDRCVLALAGMLKYHHDFSFPFKGDIYTPLKVLLLDLHLMRQVVLA